VRERTATILATNGNDGNDLAKTATFFSNGNVFFKWQRERCQRGNPLVLDGV
jgi:hypothetical protein